MEKLIKLRDENGNINVKEGMYIKWESLNGRKHEGIVKEMNCNVAIINCENCKEECCLEC